MKTEYKFITQEDAYYEQAVALRIALFFNGMPNALECINDARENKSIYLIGLENDIVVGVGRLTIEGVEGVISQMAIQENNQGRGIGKEIFGVLKNTCKELKLHKIVLSAREKAIGFYENFGFLAEGDFYPSKKTKIIHQYMSLVLYKE